jgi:excisionase family DNA binding protein
MMKLERNFTSVRVLCRRIVGVIKALQEAQMDRLMTIKEFTRRFGVARSTVYREHSSGRLAFRKIGRATRIAEGDAKQWFDGLPKR